MTDLSVGLLRWVKIIGWYQDAIWHLSFDGVRTLCEDVVAKDKGVRELAEGPPAQRCARCAEVIAWRLGVRREGA